jgi:hypothetical protein
MAKKKYHHLQKRESFYYFRKGDFRISLDTTIATEAIRLRDKLLENFHLHGVFQLMPSADDTLTFGEISKEWAKIHVKKVKYTTWRRL